MKIVYIASSIIPSRTANSIHVMKMCQAFARNGHDVTLIFPDRRREEVSGVSDIYSYYGVEPCFAVERLPWLRVRGRGYVYGYLAGKRARRLSPDVVYGRNTAGCFASALRGIRTIYEVHQPVGDLGGMDELLFRYMIRRRSFKRIVSITEALANHYREEYACTNIEIVVAPDGADPIPPGTIPVDIGGAGNGLNVGYIGHLYKGKGAELVLQLARRLPEFRFHIVGGTATDITKTHDIMPENVPENMVFHGFLPPSVVDRYRLAFDVLLAPYQRTVHVSGGERTSIAKWMSPLKIFEYMAAGKPIVCSDLPVIREVLQDGYNALLCEPDDVEGWVASLTKLKRDRTLAKRIATAALQDFTERYTWQRRAALVLEQM